ncbi:MAG: hypothetical protein N2490_07670 [Ignavibacteria bacterium]|nr:hypothetical protein [Ignavibacteria bacterium]
MFTNIIEKKIKAELSNALSEVKHKKQFSINDVILGNASDFTKQFIRYEIIKEENFGTEKQQNNLDTTTSGLALNLNSIIDKDRLSKIVEKAIKLKFNYTIRPRWTILNFIFGKTESVPTNTALKKLSIFNFYRYYLDTIINYINDRQEAQSLIITKKRIQTLLDETDTIIHEKLVTNPSSVKVKNFFLQLFKLKYEDIFQPKLDDSIPFGFIRIFLEDKAFYGVLERFMQFYNDIYDELSDSENLYDSKEIKLKDIIKVITGQVKIEEAEIKYLTPEINNDYLFLMENAFEEKETDEKWKGDALNMDRHKNSVVDKKQILDLFSKEELEKIKKKVFKNNKPLLFEFIEQVKNYNSWIEVSEYLKSIFEEYNVDIYDEDVVNFVDKLNEYFS